VLAESGIDLLPDLRLGFLTEMLSEMLLEMLSESLSELPVGDS
jgi:hypothetical protein